MSTEIKTVEAFNVKGFQARTTNAAEQSPQTAKIGGLWQQFFTSPLFEPTATVVGVYNNLTRQRRRLCKFKPGSIWSFAAKAQCRRP
jgi:predicted transcriptional regulator YdeE